MRHLIAADMLGQSIAADMSGIYQLGHSIAWDIQLGHPIAADMLGIYLAAIVFVTLLE
ncbi:hypothetical protein U1Q18_007017, partial [Sarracenia purpurea var. burkii]